MLGGGNAETQLSLHRTPTQNINFAAVNTVRWEVCSKIRLLSASWRTRRLQLCNS